MKETEARNPCPYEEPLERELAAVPASDTIKDEAFKLSRLVQSGRCVSKDEMLEVEQTVKGPKGFLSKKFSAGNPGGAEHFALRAGIRGGRCPQ